MLILPRSCPAAHSRLAHPRLISATRVPVTSMYLDPFSVNHFSTLKSGGDVTGLQSREGGESRQQRASPRRVQQPCRLSRATARRWRRSPASGCGHVGKTSCTTRPRRPRCGAQRGGAWGAGPRAAASRRTPRTASSSRRSAGSARKCAASTCGSSGAG